MSNQKQEHFGHYALNQALFDSSQELRNQMNLIADRISKMDDHKSEVSEAVYLKVKTDYLTQFDQVKKLFDQKKKEVHKELERLYKGKNEVEQELKRHQDVLEEAKFRNFLGEFSDDRFEETESIEKVEVEKLSHISHLIVNNIAQYEDLAGPAPQNITSSFSNLSNPDIKINNDTPTPILKENKNVAPVATPKKVKEDLAVENLLQKENLNSSDKVVSATKLKDKPFDDSISDILRSIPFDDDEEVPEHLSAENSSIETQAPLSHDLSNPAINDDHLTPPLGTPMPPIDEHSASTQPHAVLSCIDGDLEPREYHLKENTSIGRSPSNDVVLKEAKVSRQHSAINYIDGHYVVVDLKSSNGVMVNGKKVEEAQLQDGDILSVGSYQFCFKLQ